jgi:hypothetical protein
MGINDLAALRSIQNVLGGYIQARSGINAYRYRLHDRTGITYLISLINGYIRNSKRIIQLNNVCNLLNIPLIEPHPLTQSSG